MDWTVEDDVVDGLFFCATLAGRRWGHTYMYKQEWKRPTQVRRRLSRPRLFLGGSFREGVYRCLELKCGVLWGCPPTPRSIDDPPTAPHVCCCCQKNWWVAVRWVQMCVSIWGAVQQHSIDGWALSGSRCSGSMHGVLEIVWLHCDETQQVGCQFWILIEYKAIYLLWPVFVIHLRCFLKSARCSNFSKLWDCLVNVKI